MSTRRFRVGDYVRALIDEATGKVVGWRTPADENQFIDDNLQMVGMDEPEWGIIVAPDDTPDAELQSIARHNGLRIPTLIRAALADKFNVAAPAGLIPHDTTMHFDISDRASFARGSPGLLGEGKGQTRFRYYGPADTPALKVTGGWSASQIPYSKQKFGGFTIDCQYLLSNGIEASNLIDMVWSDIDLLQCKIAFDVSDSVHWTLNDLAISFCAYGFLGRRSASLGISNNGSPVNEMLFNRLKVTGVRNWWLKLYDSTNIVLNGGSAEACGRTSSLYSSDATRPGIWLISPGYNGGDTLRSTLFHNETNGAPHLRVEVEDYDAVVTLSGDHIRNALDFDPGPGTDIQFPDNDIQYTVTGVGALRLKVAGSMTGVNGYTGSASRPRIVGNSLTKVFIDTIDLDCQFPEELPSIGGAEHSRRNHIHAWVMFDASGTVLNKTNTAASSGVVKNGTGDFTWTFASPMLSTTFMVGMSSSTVAIEMAIVSRTTTTARVNFRTNDNGTAGALVDPTGEIGLYAIYG